MNTSQHVEGLINPNDYPAEQRELVAEFNRKLLAVSEESTRLTYTVSEKEQRFMTKLLGILAIFKVNLTAELVEDEILFRDGDVYVRVLEHLNLPIPCPLNIFLEKMQGILNTTESRERYKARMNPAFLLRRFEEGEREVNIEYDMFMFDNRNHTVKQRLIMQREEETGDIVATVSVKDDTRIKEAGRRLNQAQNTLDMSNQVIECLIQDCNVIFLLDKNDFSLTLYRTMGDDFIPSAVAMGATSFDYEDALTEYVEGYIDKNDREEVYKKVDRENVIKEVEEKGMYTITYKRIVEGEKPTYRQFIVADDRNGDSDKYVLAFKNVDIAIKKDMELAKRQER